MIILPSSSAKKKLTLAGNFPQLVLIFDKLPSKTYVWHKLISMAKAFYESVHLSKVIIRVIFLSGNKKCIKK